MANPVKVQTATTPNSLKVMSDAEMDYIAHTILTEFASSDTGVGTLSVDPVSTTGLTSIGVWSDISWDVAAGTKIDGYATTGGGFFQRFFGGFSPGTFAGVGGGSYATTAFGSYLSNDDDTTTLSNTFYQDLQTATENITIPVEYNVSLGGIKPQTDTQLNNSIISHTLTDLVSDGVGSYKLQASSPVGGTWVSKATITDTSNDPTHTYFLWRKTAATAPTTIRPLRTRLLGNQYNLIEMTDVEIETLTNRFRNKIVDTGIGQYLLQEAAPGFGTWIRAGNEIDDTRSESYVRSYLNYTSNFQAFFGGFSPGSFLGFFTPVSEPPVSGAFSGTYISATVSAVESTSLWIRTA